MEVPKEESEVAASDQAKKAEEEPTTTPSKILSVEMANADEDDISEVLIGLLPVTPVAVFHDDEHAEEDENDEEESDLFSIVSSDPTVSPPRTIEFHTKSPNKPVMSMITAASGTETVVPQPLYAPSSSELRLSTSTNSPWSLSAATSFKSHFTGPSEVQETVAPSIERIVIEGHSQNYSPSKRSFKSTSFKPIVPDDEARSLSNISFRRTKREDIVSPMDASSDHFEGGYSFEEEIITPNSIETVKDYYTNRKQPFSFVISSTKSSTEDDKVEEVNSGSSCETGDLEHNASTSISSPERTPNKDRYSHRYPTDDEEESYSYSRRKRCDTMFFIILCVLTSIIIASVVGFLFFGMKITVEEVKNDTAGDGVGLVDDKTTAPTLSPTPSPSWLSKISPREQVIRTMLHPQLTPTTLDSLNNPTSKQFEAMSWILGEDTYLLLPETLEDLQKMDADGVKSLEAQLLERFVLCVLYFELGGDSWPDRNMFLSGVDVCEWHDRVTLNGVHCNERKVEQRVHRMQFDSIEQLDGTLPPEVGLLTGLTEIQISDTKFRGTLPSELGLLTGLSRLHFSTNALTGQLPSEIGDLTLLTSLHLKLNSFSGRAPESYANLRSLTDVAIEFNELSGSVDSVFCDRSTTPEVLVADCPMEVECSCCTVCCDGRGLCKPV